MNNALYANCINRSDTVSTVSKHDKISRICRKGSKMIQLSYESGKSIYEQIVEQMKYHVIRGHLAPDDLIPSVRKMAMDLGITPNTVAKAYQELERDGIIRTIPGKGTYICATLPETKDTVRLQQVESALHSQLLELKMMGISREEACALIGRMYDELSV